MPTIEPGAIVLAILLASLVLLVSDALRYDLVALLVVVSLIVTKCLTPEEAFAGFASEPVVVIVCLAVFGMALTRWGFAEMLCRRFLSADGVSEGGLVLRISLISAVLAAFLSDAAVVAILIPMVSTLARLRGVPISRLLMPASYGAFLGDLLIVIGSAKNIAVNGVLAANGAQPFGMFGFSHWGLCILGIGLVYLAGPGRLLLPRGKASTSLTERYRVPKFVTEVLVEPSSTLINRSVADIPLFERHGIAVLGIVRGGSEAAILAPGPYNRVRTEDTLILQGEPDAIVRVRAELGLRERTNVRAGDARLASADVQLVEAVVPAGSDLAGRTLAEAAFRAHTGLNVLAISKHGELAATPLQETRLAIGDTLLIQGHLRDIDRTRGERQIIVLSEVKPPPMGRAAWTSAAILAGTIGVTIAGLLPLHVAAVAGVLVLVVARCVPLRDVYREVDWQVVVLLGGMLALARAFDKYGLARALGEWVTGLRGSVSSPHALLVMLLVASTFLAQTTTSIATAVILTPVALAMAAQLGVSDRPFVMAVLTGTNCAFMSPVAHPANAMIVGAGDYRFRDFLRVGTPLTVLILAAAAFVLPVFWPFSPVA